MTVPAARAPSWKVLLPGGPPIALEDPADEPVPYTTGHVEGRFDNAAALIGPGRLAVGGENFSCPAWTEEDGPGKLASTTLIEGAPQAGDTVNGVVVDD